MSDRMGRWIPAGGGTGLLLLALLASPALAIDPPALLWQNGGCFNSYCETGWYTSPAIADANGDGVLDVIGGSYTVMSLDGRNGALQWRAGSNSYRVWPGIVVADIDADGSLDIVTGNSNGQIHAYTGAGAVKPSWPVTTTTREVRSLSVADLDGDGRLDVIASVANSAATNTWVFSDSGGLRPGWPQLVGGPGYAWGAYNANTAVGDLDGNGTATIVVPSDVHYVCAYGPDGSKRPAPPYGPAKVWGEIPFLRDPAIEQRGWAACNEWDPPSERQRANFATSPAVLVDVDRDGTSEVVVAGSVMDCAYFYPEGVLYITPFILRKDRSRFVGADADWSAPPVDTGAPLSLDFNVIESAMPNPVAADLDLDGSQEILVPSYDGRLHAFWLDRTEHGNWPFDARRPGDAYFSFAGEPAVADLDGDGQAEVIVATWPEKSSTMSGRLFVLSASGSVLHQVDLPPDYDPFGFNDPRWNGSLAAPTLGDVNQDGSLDVVLQTWNSGLMAYTFPNTPHARVIWGTGRWNLRRTGSCAEPGPVGVTDLAVNRSGTADIALSWTGSATNGRCDARRSSAPQMTGATPVGHTAGTTLIDPGAQNDGQPILYYQVAASNGCGLAAP